MMSSASSSSASAFISSEMSLKKYDVFLSFRGEDTRSNFISHLHDALNRKNIETYIDNNLEKGDEISQALIQAIEESHISLVVFSENYASSKWCLNELTKILECKRDQGQIVIPVFYNIDPSHVRKHTGSYEQALAKHEQDLEHIKNMVQKWKTSLTDAANLAGWDSRSYGTESQFIKVIVEDVLQKLNPRYPIQIKGLVGIEGNCKQIESLLEVESREVRIIGIWGMGGIGKTTLAAAVYAKLYSQFEGHCFLENVREEFEKYGLNYLLKKLLSKLLEEENLWLDAPKVEFLFVMRRLRRKRVFIVLDDVATSNQLGDLITDCNCLGQGSRVIVTARDKHVLSKVDRIHKVKELNLGDSLQLFCLNAFNTKHPKIGYEELTKSAIAYCKGNPLVVKVLGAHLCLRSEEAWKSELRKLKKIPNVKIHNVLRTSYDDLHDTEKDIFLDIACFFKGQPRHYVTSLLESFGFFGAIGIEVLLDKALVTISDLYTIEMHDMIQEMGWEIIRQESIKDPERRSRLFDEEEVYDVLKYNRGTDAIQGIILEMLKIRDLYLSSDTFAKMTHIRFLKFHSGENVYLPYGLESLPNKLKYLEWNGFRLQSLPSTFGAEMLVELSMRRSHLEKLWDGVQNLVSLKKIDLSYSKHLIEVPDFSLATNLESISLSQCESLCQVHPSILSLHKITDMYLDGCTKIESIQTNVHLKSLLQLDLNNCSSIKEFSVTSEKLMILMLDGTSLHEPPSSIWLNKKLSALYLNGFENLDSLGNNFSDHPGMVSLRNLNLSGCKQLNASNLCFILDGLQSLISLELNNCCNLQTLPHNIGLLSSLQTLDLSGSNVESLSANIKNLSMLQQLMLDNCRKLVSLPELPPSLKMLSAINCTSLGTTTIPQVLRRNISFSLKQGRQHLGEKYVIFPGGQVPEGFGFCPAQTLITNIPHRPQSDLCGLMFYLILSQSVPGYLTGQWNIPRPGQSGKDLGCDVLCDDLISDHVYLQYCDIDELPEIQVSENGCYNIAFEMKFEDECSEDNIKGGGVCLVYASDYHQKELESELGANIKEHDGDIVDDVIQATAIEIGVGGSNDHESEDEEENTLLPRKKLEECIHQTLVTSTHVQNVNEDLGEKSSSCDNFIVSRGSKRKPQNFNDEDYGTSSTPKNQRSKKYIKLDNGHRVAANGKIKTQSGAKPKATKTGIHNKWKKRLHNKISFKGTNNEGDAQESASSTGSYLGGRREFKGRKKQHSVPNARKKGLPSKFWWKLYLLNGLGARRERKKERKMRGMKN